MQRVLSVIVVGVVTLFYHLALCFYIPLLPIYCTKTSYIKLDHHKADSDSHACAEILLKYMGEGAQVERFPHKYRMR